MTTTTTQKSNLFRSADDSVAAVIDLTPTWMPSSHDLSKVLHAYIRQLRRFVDGPIIILGGHLEIDSAQCVSAHPNARTSDLRSILSSAGVSNETIVVSPSSLYVDDLSDQIASFRSADENARLVYAQPGSEHVIIKRQYLENLSDIRVSKLPQLVRYIARGDTSAKIDVLNVPGRNAYLKFDIEEGRRFLSAYGKQPRSEWVVDVESNQLRILNREKMRAMATRLNALVPLEDKTVLEVGPARDYPLVANMLINDFGVRDYTGVNVGEFAYSLDRPNARVIQQDIYQFQPDRKYDLVFSFAVLEHVPDPVRFMHMIPNWLALGGHHYGIYFVWSSALGHHIPNNLIGYEHIAHFDHLIHDEVGIRAKLAAKNVQQAAIDEIARRMFHDDYINRERAQNVLEAMLTCGMEPIMIDPRNQGRVHQASARAAGNGFTREELSIEGFDFLLRKSEFDWRTVARLPDTSSAIRPRRWLESLWPTHAAKARN